MTNKDVIKAIWLSEVVDSKKGGIKRTLMSALNIKASAVDKRLGQVESNDAEFLFIMKILEKNGIHIAEKYQTYINQKKVHYGISEEVEFGY